MSDHRLATEHLFRTKYGEILSALLRRFGYDHFDLAEEAVQTAFQRALEKWLYSGIPENAAGWLYAVARNGYLEALRRGKTEHLKIEQLQPDFEPAPEAGLAEPLEVSDDLATMLLLCCNPELSPKAQVCLTLKSACGFSVQEIARALAMQDEAVKKTITRAKERVAQDPLALQTLQADRIAARFGLVLDTLYAMFNEGYSASSGEIQLRRDVAKEAIRLAGVFLRTALTPAERRGELHALVALMLLQFARFDARADADGLPVRLQEQDRSRWDRPTIEAGVAALAASQASGSPTIFHLEARIAVEHSLSPSFEATNWAAILSLYDQLLLKKDTPPVRLSRVVALRYVEGSEAALAELDRLAAAEAQTLASSFLFHAVRADLLESAGQSAEAAFAWQKALENAPTTADRLFVESKLKHLD